MRKRNSTLRKRNSTLRKGSSTLRKGSSTLRKKISTLRKKRSTLRKGSSTLRNIVDSIKPVIKQQSYYSKFSNLNNKNNFQTIRTNISYDEKNKINAIIDTNNNGVKKHINKHLSEIDLYKLLHNNNDIYHNSIFTPFNIYKSVYK
jgi:prophage DNA circulation protein